MKVFVFHSQTIVNGLHSFASKSDDLYIFKGESNYFDYKIIKSIRKKLSMALYLLNQT